MTEAIPNNTRQARWRRLHPARYRAHLIVSNALRKGQLERPDCCSECGSAGRLDGHHPDYRKPLLIVWLCRSCHTRLHRSGGKRHG